MLSGSINLLAAHARQSQLRQAALRGGQPEPSNATPVTRVTLRYAVASDGERLRRLRELDSAPEPVSDPSRRHRAALVAEVDGRLRAALPLDGGAPIADPFYRGAELVELLRMRAAQLAR